MNRTHIVGFIGLILISIPIVVLMMLSPSNNQAGKAHAPVDVGEYLGFDIKQNLVSPDVFLIKTTQGFYTTKAAPTGTIQEGMNVSLHDLGSSDKRICISSNCFPLDQGISELPDGTPIQQSLAVRSSAYIALLFIVVAGVMGFIVRYRMQF